jgi:5-hydroxyisourate hydrolase
MRRHVSKGAGRCRRRHGEGPVPGITRPAADRSTRRLLRVTVAGHASIGGDRHHIPMGQLTTHVLDTAGGRPAVRMRVDFSAVGPDGVRLIHTIHTNAEGRSDQPLLASDAMRVGVFELAFHVADYFRGQDVALADPPFFDRVPIRFAIADPNAHYHVPLLCSPWAYSTYRGS